MRYRWRQPVEVVEVIKDLSHPRACMVNPPIPGWFVSELGRRIEGTDTGYSVSVPGGKVLAPPGHYIALHPNGDLGVFSERELIEYLVPDAEAAPEPKPTEQPQTTVPNDHIVLHIDNALALIDALRSRQVGELTVDVLHAIAEVGRLFEMKRAELVFEQTYEPVEEAQES